MIPVNRPRLDGNEAAYLQQCIASGWISSDGPFVAEFEEMMAARIGRRHGVAVSSGTAALDIAVEMLDLKPGDEVIVPTFTIISCIHQIIRRGGIPVTVDCDAETWNMDPSAAMASMTGRTRAVLLVHIYGLASESRAIVTAARRRGLSIVEDAAEAHGVFHHGTPCGAIGDVSTFSFYPNKMITAGEGGMVLVDDEGLAERARSLRNLCFQTTQRFVHEDLGWNYRMTNLQAAVGVAQMERWDEFLRHKQHIGATYDGELADCPGITRPPARTEAGDNAYWVYGIVLDDRLTAAECGRRLAELGVGTRPFFHPIHQQPVLVRRGLFAGVSHPVAERLARQGLYLPSGTGTTLEEVHRAADALRHVMEHA
jgi:perosamine synthetase